MRTLIEKSIEYYIEKNTLQDEKRFSEFLDYVRGCNDSINSNSSSDNYSFSFKLEKEGALWYLDIEKTQNVIEAAEGKEHVNLVDATRAMVKPYWNKWKDRDYEKKGSVGFVQVKQFIDQGAKLYIYFPYRYAMTFQEAKQIREYFDYLKDAQQRMVKIRRCITEIEGNSSTGYFKEKTPNLELDYAAAIHTIEDFKFDFLHFDSVDYILKSRDSYISRVCDYIDKAGEALIAQKTALLELISSRNSRRVDLYYLFLEYLDQTVKYYIDEIEGPFEEIEWQYPDPFIYKQAYFKDGSYSSDEEKSDSSETDTDTFYNPFEELEDDGELPF